MDDNTGTSRLDAELRALAGSGAATATRFAIRHGEHALVVAFDTDSDDDITGLTLSVVYDDVARRFGGYRGAQVLRAARPLAIELRRETPGDVHAKRTGVSVEWQSGDGAFDRAVYVTSPPHPSALLDAVIGPDVQQGVLELQGLGFERVGLDVDGRVEAWLPAARFAGPGARRGSRAVAAFAQIIASLPAVVHSGATRPARPLARWTKLLGVVGAGGWLLNVGYVGLLMLAVRTLRPDMPTSLPTGRLVACLAAGLVAGLLGARLYGRAVARRAQGSSDAHVLADRAWLAAFGGFSVLGFTAAFVATLATFSG